MQLQKKSIPGRGRRNSHEIHVASTIEHKCSFGEITRQEDSHPNSLFFVSPGFLFVIYYSSASLDLLPFTARPCACQPFH